MAKYFVEENGKRKYIKNIDYHDGKLTFTFNEGEAYNGRDGYYAYSTRDMLRTNFKEDYPEVENLQCVASYY